jgi:hypothetical protein
LNRIARVLTGAAASGLLVAAQLVVAAPAQALPGYTIVRATSPSNPADKSVTVNCPGALVPVGASAAIGFAGGEVHIDAIVPTSAGVTAHASVHPLAAPGNWLLTAIAVCAAMPPGWEIVSANSPSFAGAQGGYDVTCPGIKQLIGTGGQISNANGDVVFTSIAPDLALTEVSVSGARALGGVAPDWRITAYGICVDTPPGGLTRFSQTSPLNSTNGKFTSPGCPMGQSVHGVGFEIAGPSGRILFRIIDLHQTSVRTGVGEDFVGTGQVWQHTGYVICAA